MKHRMHLLMFLTQQKQTGGQTDGWAESFYKAHGPLYDPEGNPIAFAMLTNDAKANFYIDQLREFHRQTRISSDVKTAAATAAETARATVYADVATDFGE
ncbi:MAG: hypothetical protein ACW99G_12245 [Candidatus Thorarchaeota archaeon]